MFRVVPLVVLLCLLGVEMTAAETRIHNAEVQSLGTALPDLEAAFATWAAATEGPAWATYLVPMAHRKRDLCCGGRNLCFLEQPNTYSHEGNHEGVTRRLRVLLRVEGRQLDEIRIFGEDCQVDAGGLPVYAWEGVDTPQSLDLLVSQATSGRRVSAGRQDLAESSLMAIAHHEGKAVDTLLEDIAYGKSLPRLEEEAIFWLGEARGEAGFEALVRLRHDLDDLDLREHLTFALHLSDAPGALTLLIDMAHRDPHRKVRSQALFWLSQEAGERAAEAIAEATEDDPELDVKNHAIFALSQLPPDRGVPLLIHYAENHAQGEIRKKALFWLGQSEDPRALALIEEILSR